MEGLLKSDIFFFITTLAVVALTILLAVLAVYVIKVVRNVKDISELIKSEGKLLASDMNDLRSHIRSEGLKLRKLKEFFVRGAGVRNARGKRKNKKEEMPE